MVKDFQWLIRKCWDESLMKSSLKHLMLDQFLFLFFIVDITVDLSLDGNKMKNRTSVIISIFSLVIIKFLQNLEYKYLCRFLLSAQVVKNIQQCCAQGAQRCLSKQLLAALLIWMLQKFLRASFHLCLNLLNTMSSTEKLMFQGLDLGTGIWMETTLRIMLYSQGHGLYMRVIV